ncbi:ATP-grasp domain-containing protein [Actinomadura hibisca]|uniref:ATP-grasp domain-containing protein n=1 Tax=Actinomadura hibisca TaxID=68565 RepID=UPI000831ED27|nr:hypothetical protein [Actinomadura hibisca]
MILLWGHPDERPFARVLQALRARGAEPLILDQRRPLAVAAGGTAVHTAGGRWDLADVTAAYLRPYDATRLRAVTASPARTALTRHARSAAPALCAWADHAPALVVNRPSATATNAAKASQGLSIEAAGFAVPPSLVTDDAQALAEFAAEHGAVVAKPGSGVRARVALADLDDPERMARLATCPTLFQRHIPGEDVRVHVVGDRTFAVRLTSDAIDYRVRDAALEQSTTELPGDLPERCVALARALGLVVAGIDLRMTPEGDWFCFEANPAPAFTFFAGADHVAEAMADLLHAHRPRT